MEQNDVARFTQFVDRITDIDQKAFQWQLRKAGLIDRWNKELTERAQNA